MSPKQKPPSQPRQVPSPVPEPAPLAPSELSSPAVPVVAVPEADPASSVSTVSFEGHQIFASLPLSDNRVRVGAFLFWLALAILLAGGVIVAVIAFGTWSMGDVRGAVIAGVCIAAAGGAGVCFRKAIKRLLPTV